MRTLAREVAAWGWQTYDQHWQRVARAGIATAALDVRMHGWRYLSLNALLLDPAEAAQVRRLTDAFGRLLDHATNAVLADRAWWSELAWPWPALELATLEPPHPGGGITLYGRFDWLQEEDGSWQLVEYNADTPSGGREVSGLEPCIWRLHTAHRPRRLSASLDRRLADAVVGRLAAHPAPIERVGVVSSHDWVEDMAQAWWLAGLLRARGQPTVVGDVHDLEVLPGRRVLLRGQPIQALYRFYPIERLYRHGLFAPLMEEVADCRLLLLNGLRGFLAQSKLVLAWLWENRADPALGRGAEALIERHLPATLRARDPAAEWLVRDAVVKHVNGREGDSVVFGEHITPDAWEARLLEGGYVVQRRVRLAPVDDVAVDDLAHTVSAVAPRYPCVGGFCIAGRFGGIYTRMDGPVTTGKATFLPTFATT